MPGIGPAPKPAGRRARRNADPVATKQLQLIRTPAPKLPDLGPGLDGKKQIWHPRTRDWWQMWSDSALSTDFTATDWSFLLDTALIHHNYWAHGHWTLAAELRLRVAKFGATPEDRARLRIVFAEADEKDGGERPGAGASGARARRGALRSVPAKASGS